MQPVWAQDGHELYYLGLDGALREGAIQRGTAGLRISIESSGELSRLPAAVEVACYRIVQEALANVVRHARASHCSIRIRLDEEAGVLNVDENDGFLSGMERTVDRLLHERAPEIPVGK